jgi:hypothetical protein
VKLKTNAYTMEVFPLKTTTVKNECDVKYVYSGHPHYANKPKIACARVCLCVFVTGVRNDIEAAICYEKFHTVVLINQTCCFWPC